VNSAGVGLFAMARRLLVASGTTRIFGSGTCGNATRAYNRQGFGRKGTGTPVTTIITRERPDSADAVLLIAELEAHLDPLYPAKSRHGYSVEKLIAQDVAFFLLRASGTAAGCGGIQLFGTTYGELKRMYVRPPFRGLGFGKMLLNHLADHARGQGVGRLRLETGIHQVEAIRLYERMGFQRIAPFGVYMDDPLSLFYEKRIM
jgi:putative acetyltransferase